MKCDPNLINITSMLDKQTAYKFATSIALHCLRLTIPGVVIGAPTFVASGRTRSARKASAEATTTYEASARRYNSSASSDRWAARKRRIGARSLSRSLARGRPASVVELTAR